MKKKVCKKCKLFVDGETCPICKKNNFSTSFQGRVYFVDIQNSTIAKNIGVELKGEYAIKVK